MEYEQFLEQKEEITAALEEAILKTLETMTVEEIKQIDFFSYKNLPV